MRDLHPIMLEERIYKLEQGGGGSGTTDYEDLENKPKIENVELVGNRTFEELGIASAEDLAQTNEDLIDITQNVNQNTNDIGELKQDLIADGVPFRFGKTEDGKYGYILNEGGADTVIPFKSKPDFIIPTIDSKGELLNGGYYVENGICYVDCEIKIIENLGHYTSIIRGLPNDGYTTSSVSQKIIYTRPNTTTRYEAITVTGTNSTINVQLSSYLQVDTVIHIVFNYFIKE